MSKEQLNEILKNIESKGLFYFSGLDINIQKNGTLIKEVLKEYGDTSFRYFNSSIINDPKYILKYFYKYDKVTKFTDIWKSNKQVAIKLMKGTKNPNLYMHLNNELKNDKEIVISLLSINPYLYEVLNINLRSDIDIYLALLGSKKLDKDFIPLKYAGDKIKDNEDLVLLSLKYNGLCFSYVSDRLKLNRKVAIYAISSNFNNIELIDESLKKDMFFMESVTFKYGLRTLRHVDEDMLKNKDFALGLIDVFGASAVMFFSPEIKTDNEILLSCIEKEIDNLGNNYYISKDIVYSVIKSKMALDDSYEQLIKNMISIVINEKNNSNILVRKKS